MPEHKGISCELHVEGQKATEYQVTQTGSISTSHIISQEGKIFSFHLNITSATLGSVGRLDLELWADGQKLDAFTFTETNYLVDDAQIQDSTGAVKVVKLRFAKLKTVDEKKADQETRQDILRKLGTLEIKLWRAHQDAIQTGSFAYQQEPSNNPIHEKSIKGESITHCTEFTNAKPIQNLSSSHYIYTMPIYKGIDASVIIDGTKAQEYNKSTNYFTSTVTTYIVAEEDGKSDQKATAQKLGTIEVRLRRGETEITENIFAGCPFIPGSTEGNGSYQTEYDLQETVPDLPPYVKTISIDTRRPWVTFKFKYGSRELIRAKHPFRGLVPCIQGSPRSRDPSDQATESEINAKLPEYELPPEYEEMVAEEDR
ncbi:hypothetical protein TWF679_007232 [Orbilia oligospora]|uniref:DUF7918 domain-containing protein n=1 Tax=Orbilia oligospora TaxID=2813651 RepID=A0A8H8V7X0_ORBOL|nr:hypothetical protein TWF679_007232 [Orbilia oligospora]